MEQHPIPRNISSFEFHLIGDMTIRQFAYLAGGVLLAYLIFKIAPFPALIKYPLMGLSAFTGFALAFLPIQERPLDRWLIAFLKSINSPTQYLWHKDNTPPEILLKPIIATVKTLPQNHQAAHQDANNKLEVYLSTLPSQPHQSINLREKKYVDSTLLLFNSLGAYQTTGQTDIPVNPTVVPQIQPVVPPVQKIADIKPEPTVKPTIPQVQSVSVKTDESKFTHEVTKEPTVEKKAAGAKQITQQAIKTNETSPKIIPTIAKLTKTIAEDKALPTTPFLVPSQVQTPSQIKIETEDAEKQLERIRQEKEILEKELQKLKEEIDKSKKPSIVKPEVKEEEKKPTIKTITPKTAANEIGIPKLPQTPNIIMGVVKDTQRKLLPNIIITVKDVQGLPHRALKTNRLGQFSTATPLSNGTYHLEAEDPLNRYIFDIAEIVLTGKVFLPVEITAKGEKEIMREKLAKELFGNPSTI